MATDITLPLLGNSVNIIRPTKKPSLDESKSPPMAVVPWNKVKFNQLSAYDLISRHAVAVIHSGQ